MFGLRKPAKEINDLEHDLHFIGIPMHKLNKVPSDPGHMMTKD